MKLFQIEEPDGTPDADAPGAAVGIDLAGGRVAIALGGNAELLPAAEGETLGTDPEARLLGLRGRAEKQLARPVTHAVLVADLAEQATALAAAEAAGIAVLKLMPRAEAVALAGRAPAADAPALGAAVLAEDLAPSAEAV